MIFLRLFFWLVLDIFFAVLFDYLFFVWYSIAPPVREIRGLF